LHDTLLQSFQAVLMKFSAVTFLVTANPAEAQKTLASVIEQAGQAINEGREAVQGLRSSTQITNDVAQTIGSLGQQLVGQAGQNGPAFHVHVEGNSRELHPLVRDEVCRVACEAIRNAFRHAHASRIEVEIRYDRRHFVLLVRDDGKGIDRDVFHAGRRSGHHGLPGMQERAQIVGGKLTVQSEANRGTAVDLTIPASLAYIKQPTQRWRLARVFRKGL
jgi:signal transduction histidine kinase